MTEQTFDPTEHTVEEVQAYLAEHPDQREAVLAAEKEGKARKTVVEAPAPSREPSRAVASNLNPEYTQADEAAERARDEAIDARVASYDDPAAGERLREGLARADEIAAAPLPSMATAADNES